MIVKTSQDRRRRGYEARGDGGMNEGQLARVVDVYSARETTHTLTFASTCPIRLAPSDFSVFDRNLISDLVPRWRRSADLDAEIELRALGLRRRVEQGSDATKYASRITAP